MSEWKLKNLKDLSVSITSGLTPLKNNSEYWDNPVIPWLKTDQLGEKYIWDTNTKISEIALEKTSLKLYPPKTLSIAMYGEGKTRGNISIIMKPMATNQACCNIIINDEKADFEYVYYYMKTQYESLRGLSSGVRNNLNANDIKNYEIRIPESIVEQNNISKVLSVLDQKIAINNQINEELEAMAKTLYDYWFVQFNFPDENGKPYKSSGGKMVYNDQLKREIPEGWGVKQLGELCEFRNGINYEKSETGDTLSKIVNVRNISNSSTFVTTHDLDSIALDRRRIESYLVTDRTILITRSGIPGATRIVSDIPANTIYSGFIIGATVANLNLFYYVFYHLKNIEMLMSNQSAGTIMKNISQTTLSEIRIAIPNKEIQKVFSNQVRSLLDVIENNLKQNQELTQLRDWLLPMLMNGQVKVEDNLWKL
ncbi:TPA: restriction endonuclease subunit S [Streptococcus suis]|uniref:restriction endonuclease subunit S n=1 Tax=Streptococcus suis TaxID=1307 RepID=UPI0024127197|nr:restriction endonuclease subunit S [Streptococcus suis]MDG4521360.1 restriction endonuclease subunit S [Streptococcus suis]HEL1837638.1 restriction endonuclease subunit S [Streptococcus suis]HEL2247183.1 restriction endonuclease subunit S [Streptococcus suis]HEL2259953.1 restriction endonuclease subunit S [Streptococcus suis]HEL2553484.1 restriction endonuclease subunit S [Streptococcus suis]